MKSWMALALGWLMANQVSAESPHLTWRSLAPVPDAEGLAGMFAGVIGDRLVVAGGANFPDRRPWEGGTKHWDDRVWMLDEPGGAWREVGRLPEPRAYGVTASVPGGMICIGGGNATAHTRDCLLLEYGVGRLKVRPLAPLPKPCSSTSGAAVGNTFYLAGGLEQPTADRCLNSFWALDLDRPSEGWRELPPCPGSERMLAVAGSASGAFYLFSGVKLKPGGVGLPEREYLRDAWRYRPSDGWQRLADLPRSANAAPSPACTLSDGRLLVASGDDGLNVNFRPQDAHPGFPREALLFDPADRTWTSGGDVPFSLATAPTCRWRGQWVIVSGEARPGIRSPAVWMAAEAKTEH